MAPAWRGTLQASLRRQAKLTAQVGVGRFLQALDTARFPVGKGAGADKVQAIAIGQLGGAQRAELVSRSEQFQFGRQRRLHHSDSTSTQNRYSRERGGASSPWLQPGDSALALVEIKLDGS